MIKFDVRAMNKVASCLESGREAISEISRAGRLHGSFTTAPSLNDSFIQHVSFFDGQSGSAVRVVKNLKSDIDWLQNMFSNHVEAFDLQDQLGGATFKRMGSGIEERDQVASVEMPARDFKPIDNLLYTTPTAVVEATTPLAALMAMFEADDSGPIRLAAEWNRAGNDLVNSMTQLQQASTALGASAEGYSFDMARSAIESVVKTGTTVGNNAVLMATSIGEFPSVRIANLNALRAIQATTATITEPAARLAAEQSAVTTFVSTQLQPSLELLRPPVANLGVPVVGHTGGGSLEASTAGQSSGPTVIHSPAGGTLTTTQAGANNLGAEAAQAAAKAPNPTGTVAPASAAHTAVSPAGATATPVKPMVTATASAPTTAGNTFDGALTTRPAGLNATVNGGVTSPLTRQGGDGGRQQGGVGRKGGPVNRPGASGRGPVLPQLPWQAQSRGTQPQPLPATNNHGGSTNNRWASGVANNPVHGGTGRGGMMSVPGAGGQTTGAQGAVANGHGRGGMFGSAGHGVAVGPHQGRPSQGARGAGTLLGGHPNARNAKASHGIFGKGTWARGVGEYFRREFLGERKRTVKEVIR